MTTGRILVLLIQVAVVGNAFADKTRVGKVPDSAKVKAQKAQDAAQRNQGNAPVTVPKAGASAVTVPKTNPAAPRVTAPGVTGGAPIKTNPSSNSGAAHAPDELGSALDNIDVRESHTPSNGRPVDVGDSAKADPNTVGVMSPGDKVRLDDMVKASTTKALEGDPLRSIPEVKAILDSIKDPIEKQKIEIELTEMLRAQADMANLTPPRGSVGKEILIATAKAFAAIAKNKAKIEKAVEEAYKEGRIADKALLDNLLKNAVATYGGLGYLSKNAKPGAEKAALEKLEKVLETLEGPRLVGFLKYLDSYGTAYRRARGAGDSIQLAHHKAAQARSEFVASRSSRATNPALRDAQRLEETLRACTNT